MVREPGVEVVAQDALQQVKEELEDHLNAINENTDEIQCNYDLLRQLNAKIDKLTERLDLLQSIITNENVEQEKDFTISPLTKKEKSVFQALYELAHEKESVTYEELARRACMTDQLVAQYIKNLIEKGVPVWKKHAAGKVHLTLDPDFVLEQAENNVVGVTIPLTHWF